MKSGDRSFTHDKVRLIDVEGEQVGVVPLTRAHEMAHEANEDLVIVAEKANPPVVRIMNFGKLQYEYKKNLRAQRKNTVTHRVKELKFHVNVGSHDYDIKVRRALEFLEKGYTVKITITLRGREMAHPELAYELMDKISEELREMGEAENKAKLAGRTITVTFVPN